MKRLLLGFVAGTFLLAGQSSGVAVQAVRLEANPIIAESMMSAADGDSINGPSLIAVPQWVRQPLGKYYLYFSHHAGKYIRLAYADSIGGPWKMHEPGVVQIQEQRAVRGHVASPEVVIDEANRRIYLFYHGKSQAPATPGDSDEAEPGQQTAVAVSDDGLHFRPLERIVGPAYLRIFRRGTSWFGVTGRGALFRAAKLGDRFEPVGQLVGPEIPESIDPARLGEPGAPKDRPLRGADRYSIRHAAVDIVGDQLAFYFTCVGHRPERIFVTWVKLQGPPGSWRAHGVTEVLRPKEQWEGANLPLEYSKGGRSKAWENGVRDPAIYREGDRTWLLYSTAGEHGIGIAELRYQLPKTAEFVLQDRPQRPEPFPESRLQINPPTFRWPAVAKAQSYRVELARTMDGFASLAQSATVTEAFYRPLQPLSEGKWFWRYRADGSARWSETESFTITSDLARWPVPAWKQLLDRIPGGHPRLATDLTRVRQNAAALGAHRMDAWKTRIRTVAATPYSLNTYQDRVPGASDPRAPKQLIWAAKAAGVDLARPIVDLAWLWITTGDRWFLDAARQRTLLAAKLDPHGFVSEKNSDFGNSAIVHGLAVAYDLLYKEFDASERQLIRRTLVERCRPIFAKMRGASQNLMRAHNWQHVFLDGLMGAIAIHGEEPETAGWIELGLKSFVGLYPWFGGNDGGSHEGVRYYHATELLPSLHTRDLFAQVFGLQLEDGNPWFRANPYYLIYSFPPASVKARLGDSIIGPGASPDDEQESDEDDAPFPQGRAHLAALRMATLYGNGHAAAYAARIRNREELPMVEALQWGASTTVQPEPLDALPAARVFHDIGAVFTHSAYTNPDRNVRLVFHSSPYGALGHAHADQNSFHIIASNEDLLIDSGYYTPAGDPHRQEYSVQTQAHNTILVDGKGQSYGDTRGHGRIRHFEQNRDWVYMIGSAESAYPDTALARFDRHIVWLKGDAVQTYVIVDDIAGANTTTKHRFDWLLHAATRMHIDDASQRVTVDREKTEAVITFAGSEPLHFEQTDQFPVPAIFWRKGQNYPLPNQWHLRARMAQASNQQVFVAVIQVSARGVAKPTVHKLTGHGIATAGFRITHDPGSRMLRIERNPASQ